MTMFLLVFLSSLMYIFLNGYRDELIDANKEYPVVWIIISYLFYCVLLNVIRIY